MAGRPQADGLPGVLGEIEAIAGADAALRIVESAGGTRIYIPTPGRLTADHRLVSILGLAAATEIAERLAGSVLEIPTARPVLAHRLFEGGATIAEVARRLGITERRARQLRGKYFP